MRQISPKRLDLGKAPLILSIINEKTAKNDIVPLIALCLVLPIKRHIQGVPRVIAILLTRRKKHIESGIATLTLLQIIHLNNVIHTQRSTRNPTNTFTLKALPNNLPSPRLNSFYSFHSLILPQGAANVNLPEGINSGRTTLPEGGLTH